MSKPSLSHSNTSSVNLHGMKEAKWRQLRPVTAPLPVILESNVRINTSGYQMDLLSLPWRAGSRSKAPLSGPTRPWGLTRKWLPCCRCSSSTLEWITSDLMHIYGLTAAEARATFHAEGFLTLFVSVVLRSRRLSGLLGINVQRHVTDYFLLLRTASALLSGFGIKKWNGF